MSIPLIVLAVIGLLMYGFASNGKIVEIGRLIFVCALLAMCLGAAPHMLRLLS